MKCLTLLYLFGSIIKDTTYLLYILSLEFQNFCLQLFMNSWIQDFLYFCNYIHHALPMTSIFKLPWIPNNFMCVFIYFLYYVFDRMPPPQNIYKITVDFLSLFKIHYKFNQYFIFLWKKLWLWWWWAYYLIILIYTSICCWCIESIKVSQLLISITELLEYLAHGINGFIFIWMIVPILWS